MNTKTYNKMTHTRNPRRQVTYTPHFGNLINEFFNTAVGDVVQKADNKHYTNPAVNVIEHEDKVELQVALPGYGRDDVNIIVDEDILKLESKEKEATEGQYRLREFNYAGFKKNFRLPEDIDTNKVEAKFDLGILTVTLSKKEEAIPQPPRQITIQ